MDHLWSYTHLPIETPDDSQRLKPPRNLEHQFRSSSGDTTVAPS